MNKCKFPECDYESRDKGSFDSHHIVPKSQGGSDKLFNRIQLCPNCHRKIFIESMSAGIHSVKRPGSIIILNKFDSTAGEVLHYKSIDSNIEYYWWYRLNSKSQA